MQLEFMQPGDIVDVVAPASRCTNAELKAGIQAIKDLGFVPRVPKDLFGRSELFSNSDEVRLKHLRKAIYARDSKMIWCVRGGYGAIRMMPEILKWPKPKQAKIFLGYSDISTLHAYFNQKWNWPTYHGPLVDRLGRGQIRAGEKRELLGMIRGQLKEIEFKNLKALNSAAKKSKTLRGTVRGGNLCTLQSSIGTPAAFKPKNCILFLEDTGERPHRVDRMLTQAAQNGWFKGAKAIVFGRFQLSDARDRRILWNDVIARFAKRSKIPVLKGLPVGHDPKVQFTLPFNTPAVLKTGAKGSLKVKSGIKAR